MTESSLQQETLSSPSQITLHPNVYKGLTHPQKGLEMRSWLKIHGHEARYWRGEHHETMMHWAFLSDWVFATELQQYGLSFTDIDHLNRTPMDWLNDRLWMVFTYNDSQVHLSSGGKERILKQSINQIEYLWNLGARPSSQALFCGIVWLRTGAWSLLELLKNDSHYTWENWDDKKAHAIHFSIFSPPTHHRFQFFQKWKEEYDIDLGDKEHRSALWYAVDSWIYSSEWRTHMEHVIMDLINCDANPLSVLNPESPLKKLWDFYQSLPETDVVVKKETQKILKKILDSLFQKEIDENNESEEQLQLIKEIHRFFDDQKNETNVSKGL